MRGFQATNCLSVLACPATPFRWLTVAGGATGPVLYPERGESGIDCKIPEVFLTMTMVFVFIGRRAVRIAPEAGLDTLCIDIRFRRYSRLGA